jgi:hypothetical protein
MGDNEVAWRNIYASLNELEALDRESRGSYRQASDKEAFDVVCRIERRLLSLPKGRRKPQANIS